MRFPLLLLSLLTLNTTVALSEVRLLTGDSNNQLFDRDAIVVDLSADGRLVLFASGPPSSGNPPPGITRGGLYLRNLDADTLTFVGVPPGGENNNDPTGGGGEASMSDDGRFLAWTDLNSKIVWRDNQGHETREITPDADGACRRPMMSSDGRYVAFVSVARNLVQDTTLLPAENRAAVYLYDSYSQQITVASLTFDGKGLSTGVGSSNPITEFDFSSDGKFVFFSTDASGVHPDRANTSSSQWFWTYRRNVTTGEVVIVGRNAAGEIPSGNFSTPRTDAHGNRVAFVGGFIGASGGPTLVDGYSGGFGFDIYRKEISTGAVVRVSQTTDGSAPNGFFDGEISINADGSVVAFGSSASNYVAEPTDPNDSEGSPDVFRADISGNSATVTLISKPVTDNENVKKFSGPYLPGTGDYVAFATGDLKSMLGAGNNDSIFKHCVGVGSFTFAPAKAPSVGNVSTRLQVLTGDNALIGGFIVIGNSPKRIVVRGIGPSLGAAGVAGALANPVVELYGSSGLISSNDDWRQTQENEIIESGVAPSNDLESTIIETLEPGNYTAILRGKDGSTGVGLVEAYDLDQAVVDSRLGNISTRGFVELNDNVMIGGFIVGGSAGVNTKVVVRAIGPSLANFGITNALQDPTLDLFNGNGALVRSNDNWRSTQEAELQAVELAPTDDRESALIESVAPGNYTAIVRGAGNTTGVGLVEVYNLTPASD